MSQEEFLCIDALENIWGNVGYEISQVSKQYKFLQQLTAEEWVKRIGKYTQKEWFAESKYVQKTEKNSRGLTKVFLKGRRGLRGFTSRIARALKTRVEWRVNDFFKSTQGSICDNCLVHINTDGGEMFYSVSIENVPEQDVNTSRLEGKGIVSKKLLLKKYIQ